MPTSSAKIPSSASRDGTLKPNRLSREKSPYLLQHARNPVDWFPWGEDAFISARDANKPIFLSIGYSTCHWCHVMERESFENEVIAKILNNHFVSIKLDREERPDIDRVYMTFVQATTGGGGWPMSVFLAPDLKPFYGGTYFPVDDRHGQIGFKTLLLRIAELWEKDHSKLIASGEAIVRQLREYTTGSSPDGSKLNASLLDNAFKQFAHTYEPSYGGFGGAPKFPRPVTLNFMLRYWSRTGRKAALDMTLHTLRKMADGGMHDHLGGGFHRYSVDSQWHVPHFEKMLYDQAQLACSYLEAFQITHDLFYANTGRDILDYVLGYMTGIDGNFYSAEDADSLCPDKPKEKAEGAFYVWEIQQIEDALDKNDATIFSFHYGVKENGNALSDPYGEFTHKNILIVSHTVEETSKHFGKSPGEIRATLNASRSTLHTLRASRRRPHLDDKTLTAWNGLMISAFARAAQILDVEAAVPAASPSEESERPGTAATTLYLQAATRAAEFVEEKLYDKKSGKLLRRYRDGDAAIEGYCDDYAFFIQGLLDLYEASFDAHWLTLAIALQKKQNELFWDKEGGGYFTTSGEDPTVILRMKEDYDGAEPSPNSVAALNLLRLAEMTDNEEFRGLANKALSSAANHLERVPTALPQMLVALDFSLSKPKQIIIAGKPDAPDTRAMLRAVHQHFIPNKILLLADGGKNQSFLARFLPFVDGIAMQDGKATAYVCENYTCQLPTNDLAEMTRLLTKEKK